jgi:homoserine acetyltransferase
VRGLKVTTLVIVNLSRLVICFLKMGETLPDITIAYRTWGTLNADKSNAILINHAMTGWSDVTAWWPQMVRTRFAI